MIVKGINYITMSKNKSVLITGASSGIGRKLAKRMAKDGYQVTLVARRLERLQALSTEIEQQGGKTLVLACDVTDKESMHSSIRQCIEHFGKLDILILNAGGTIPLGKHYNSENIIKNFNLNVFSGLYAIEAALPIFKDQGSGHIVALSSMASYLPVSQWGVYSAAKQSLSYLCDALRREVAEYNIKITVISPGYIKSPLTARNVHKMPFLMPLEKGVETIYSAIKKQKRNVSFPIVMMIVLKIAQWLPGNFLDAILAKQHTEKSDAPLVNWDD